MAEGSLSVFGFRWHYGRNNGHYNSTVRHRNDVAKHSKDAEIKFKTEASKDNTEMQMHRDKLVANLESSRQAAVDKLTNNVMDHRERMFGRMCDHLLAMKKLDLEQQQENNYHERKLKRLQPKKKHCGGRQGRRRRPHSSSQPIVEEVDESER
ncbi:hypothetical protein AAVH_36695 [Aphelenchoides avenae]|nr:hypothetical protein AAVH_36695 [Aphelenchus avenae]